MSTYDINGAANAIVDIVGRCATLPREDAVAAVRALLEQYGPPTPEEDEAWVDLERRQANEATGPVPPAQASGQSAADEIEGLRAHVALLKAALAQAERENDELRRAQPAAATVLADTADVVSKSYTNVDEMFADMGVPPSGQSAALFRKKPVTIEAIQWTGRNLKEVIDFTGKHPRWHEWFSTWEDYERHVQQDGQRFKIFTLEGTMIAEPGDWIIKGVKGEFYPCKPDIFAATYEPAQAEPIDADVLLDALSNLEHDNYERSYNGSKNREADAALIRAALAAAKGESNG